MKNFTHLHVHSVHSLLDGFSRVNDLVDTVKSFGMHSVALTDHGSMAGIPRLWKAAKELDVKPIAGMEAYVCTDMSKKEGGRAEAYYHLTLIAKNLAGYKNLCKITTAGYKDGFYYRPRVDLRFLSEHSDGLIGLAGCLGGWPQQLILGGKTVLAADVVDKYKSIFKDFFLEIQDTGEPDQKKVMEWFSRFEKDGGYNTVITGDSHYTHKSDKDMHDTLLCIGTHKPKSATDRLSLMNGDYYVKSTEEMYGLGHPSTWYENSLRISEMCERYDLPRASGLPSLGDLQTLEAAATEGLMRKMREVPGHYWERLMYELDVIGGLGFHDYFLICHNITKFADSRRIFHGWGRGSSAGSLVAYALGITNIDPVKFDLYFERFLNSARHEPPDIDMDFADTDRPQIEAYIKSKFGEDKVANISSYGTLGPRQIILDAARVLEIPESLAKITTQLLPYDPMLTVSQVFESKETVDAITHSIGDKVVDCMRAFEGIPRHASIHAAGFLIDSEPLSDKLPFVVPRVRSKLASQYEYDDLKLLGFEKFDILGVRTLRIIGNCLRKLNLDPNSIPLDDTAAYAVLKSGKTVGVFQFEHWGSQKFLQEFRPVNFEDVMMVNALYRPGPMQGGKGLKELIARRSGRTPVSYWHKSLKPILEKTYGIMVFQEQVMKVVQVLAGWSLGEADELRYVIGKKKQDELVLLAEKFRVDCVKLGHTTSFADKMYDEITFFARYGWNRAHAAAYGMVTYVCAYLKANHTATYMVELMNSEIGDHERLAQLIRESNRLHVSVAPPHVNRSEKEFMATSNKDILCGLSFVKYLGEKAIDQIVSERRLRGSFLSEEGFRARLPRKIVNSRAMDSMKEYRAFKGVAETEAKMEVPF